MDAAPPPDAPPAPHLQSAQREPPTPLERPPTHAFAWGAGAALVAGAAVTASAAAQVDVRAAGFLTLTLAVALVALPFAWFGYHAGRRWVGLEPTPWLRGERAGRGAPTARAWTEVALVIVVGVALSLPLTLAMVPAMEIDEDAHAFSTLSPLAALQANLVIVAEEILFRLGMMWPLLALFRVRRADPALVGSWRDALRLPIGAWAAIVLSGAVFGLAHVPDGLAMGAPLGVYAVYALVQKGLVMGTLLGWLAYRRGVGASIVAHYLVNVVFLALAGVLF